MTSRRAFGFAIATLAACTPRASTVATPNEHVAVAEPTTEHEPTPPEDSDMAPTPDPHVEPAYRCPVVVEAILSDERYRGSPDSPSHQDWVAGLDPEDYEMYIAESHGESYRQCTYRVLVQGKRWRYVETFDTTFAELPETWCDDARAHVAAEIQRTTQGCKDLHRGAYYGSDLVEIR